VNALTTSAFCPTSKQPELKHAAVKVLKAELPWTLLAMAWLPADKTQATREALSALMAQFAFASCVPFSNNTPLDEPGRERTGVLLRAAAHEAPPDALVMQIEALLGMTGADTLRYADKKRGQRRAARLARQGDNTTLEGIVLAGDTSAEGWLKTLLQEELPAQTYGRLLLVPGAKAPVAAVQSRGKPVCTCFNVTDAAITAQLAHCHGTDDDRLAQLKGQLRCGPTAARVCPNSNAWCGPRGHWLQVARAGRHITKSCLACRKIDLRPTNPTRTCATGLQLGISAQTVLAYGKPR